MAKATRINTVKEASSLAFKHRKAIKNGDLTPFIPAFAFALVKDGLLDVLTATIIAAVVTEFLGLFITVYLFFFLWGKGKWKVRLVIFIFSLFDLIPEVSLIPFSTLCVAYAFLQARKHAKQAKKALSSLEGQTNAIRIREYQAERAAMAAEEEQSEGSLQGEARDEEQPQGAETQIGGSPSQVALAQSLAVPPSASPVMSDVRLSRTPAEAGNLYEGERGMNEQSGVHSGDVAAASPMMDGVQGIRAPIPKNKKESKQTPPDVDIRERLRKWLEEDKRKENGAKDETDVTLTTLDRLMNDRMGIEDIKSLHSSTSSVPTEGIPPGLVVNRTRPGEIKPDFENDPTLVLFTRVHNPEIQAQMVDLLLKNEDHRVTETERVSEFTKDEDGNVLMQPDSDIPVMKWVDRPRFINYIKKTRDAVAQEVRERIRSVTELGGSKNANYLYPKGADTTYANATYDLISDETHMNSGATLGKRLTPKQLEVVLSHEKGHQLRRFRGEEYLDAAFRNTIDWNNLSYTEDEFRRAQSTEGFSPSTTIQKANESLRDYLTANEIAERMSQLKNYFGFTGNEKFTKRHLDYARKHYVKDVGFDNNMSQFLRAITPEKEGAFIEGINTFGI